MSDEDLSPLFPAGTPKDAAGFKAVSVKNKDLFCPPRRRILPAIAALTDMPVTRVHTPTKSFSVCQQKKTLEHWTDKSRKIKPLPVRCENAQEFWERLLTREVLPASWASDPNRFFLDDWDESTLGSPGNTMRHGSLEEGVWLGAPPVWTVTHPAISGEIYKMHTRFPDPSEFPSECYVDRMYDLRERMLAAIDRRRSVPPTMQYALLFASDAANMEAVENLARESAALLTPNRLYPQRVVWRCVQRKRLVQCLLPFVTLKNCGETLDPGHEIWRLGSLALGIRYPGSRSEPESVDRLSSPVYGGRWFFGKLQGELQADLMKRGRDAHPFRPLVEIMQRGYLVDSITEEEIVLVAPNYPSCRCL